MHRQLIFVRIFKPGTTFKGGDGGWWDYLEPGDPNYDAQFREAIVHGEYALTSYDPPMVHLWQTVKLGRFVDGPRGRIPALSATYGGCEFERAAREFEEFTGCHVDKSMVR